MNILETTELHTLSGRTVVGAGDTAGNRRDDNTRSVRAAFLWGQTDPKEGNKYVCKEKKSG